MNILCDMDGVLVDFVGPACESHGKTKPYQNSSAAGSWDIVGLLGMTPEEFWGPLGYVFWASLPWMSDGRRILEVIFDATQHVYLLTSPTDDPGSLSGKYAWVKRELPDLRRRMLVGAPKHLCAMPDAVLVDDSDANIDRFSDAGGRTILVPRPWNSRHAESHRAVECVVEDLARQYQWEVDNENL